MNSKRDDDDDDEDEDDDVDVDSVIRLVVLTDNDGHDGSTMTKSNDASAKSDDASAKSDDASVKSDDASATSDDRSVRLVHDHEFRSGSANVTPREITSVRYPMKPCGEAAYRNRIMSATYTYDWSPESYDDYFLRIGSESSGDLLDDVLSCAWQRFDDEETYRTRYDVGPGEYPVADRRHVQLTESPTYRILNVPNTVVVEGDGDYDWIRTTNDVYRDNCARKRAQTDTVTQTANASADKPKDEQCQTIARHARAAGTKPYGYVDDVVDAIDGQGRDSARTAMFAMRIAAQNVLQSAAGRTGSRGETPPPPARVRLDYRFALARDDDGPAVGCTRWNEAETHLLAVAYGGWTGDEREDDAPNAAAVAVWNTKNPYAPERYYEFDESAAVTCLRFSAEQPNRLAIGFDSGEILIIDVCNERLEIVFRKTSSKHSPPKMHGILGLFWTVPLENGLFGVDRHECLVTCNSRGGIERYCHWNETFERQTVCENDGLADNDDQPLFTDAGTYSKSICHATEFHRLGRGVCLVGTADGSVYACKYEDLWCCATRTNAHFGVIRSLEKSPYSPDVYLSTGGDCTVKIWIGDVLVEPVITLYDGGQVEKAIWSRTDPTVIVSIVDNRLHVWDMDETTNAPVAVCELRASDRTRCTDAEFTSDGRHLCVSDTGGNVIVYAWSDAGPSSARQTEQHCSLMRCVAWTICGKTYLTEMLSEHRPEYADVLAAECDGR